MTLVIQRLALWANVNPAELGEHARPIVFQGPNGNLVNPLGVVIFLACSNAWVPNIKVAELAHALLHANTILEGSSYP